jgi:hypothetical protein
LDQNTLKLKKLKTKKPLKSLRLHSLVNTKENEDVKKKMRKKIVVKDLMNVLNSNQTMGPKGGSQLMHLQLRIDIQNTFSNVISSA